MGVKEGYKQTEVGIIPEDWVEVELGDAGYFISGNGFPIKYQDSKKSKYPFYKVSDFNISRNKKYMLNANNYISERTREVLSAKIIPKYSILFAKIGMAIFLERKKISSVDCCIDNNMMCFVCDERILNSRVVYYYFLNLKLSDYASATALPSLSSKDLKRIKIFIPPTIEEQKAIATTLSDIDDLIDSLSKLIEKKKNIKRGAMQELLTGKKSLEGFSGEWSSKKVGSLGIAYGGLAGKQKEDFGRGNSFYIPFMNVMSNPVIDLEYLDRVEIKNNEKQNKARCGDLFFNTSSETPEEVGICSVLLEENRELYLNSFCFGFRLNNLHENNPLFLSYLFRSQIGRDLMFSLAQGATRYNLSKRNFYKLVIKIPEFEEQKAIATIISDMDLEIEKLKAKLEKYKAIKKGMMQELLTGRIRLLEGA